MNRFISMKIRQYMITLIDILIPDIKSEHFQRYNIAAYPIFCIKIQYEQKKKYFTFVKLS